MSLSSQNGMVDPHQVKSEWNGVGIHGSGKLYPRHLYFATVASKCVISVLLFGCHDRGSDSRLDLL